LAERSQNAAKQIDDLSKSSVKIADKSGEELQRVVPDIQRTAQLVQEIAAGSMEQNTGAQQINTALLQLNSITQRNAAASEEMAASSEQLFAQAEQLKFTVSFYKSAELDTLDKGRTVKEKTANAKETTETKVKSSRRTIRKNIEIVDDKDKQFEEF
jgi:methyl-accepting chemotaxis protein